MGKGYLIDSNIVIAYLNKKIPDDSMEFMNAIIDQRPNISIITKIEILRFNTSDENYRTLTDFVAESLIYNLDEAVVDSTIAICKNSRIKLPDAIIAATALANNFVLITQNIPDFKAIKTLKAINPWDKKPK